MTDLVEFTVIDADGIPVRVGFCPDHDADLQASEPGETLVIGPPPPDGSWRDGGTWQARPTLDMPATKSLAVDEVWTITTPAGTLATVDGSPYGEVDGSIAFDTAGIYRLRFDPPPPYLPAECVVTVT